MKIKIPKIPETIKVSPKKIAKSLPVFAAGAVVGHYFGCAYLGIGSKTTVDIIYSMLVGGTFTIAFHSLPYFRLPFPAGREVKTAQIVIESLKKAGVLEISLEELRGIWSESKTPEKKKQIQEIDIDMSKMYHFWRDETAIEIHKQEEKGFSMDETKEFFKYLKKKLRVDERLRDDGKKESLERSVFQAEYRIILFLLEQLDEHGHCPSVVDLSEKRNQKSEEPDNIKAKENINQLLTTEAKTRLRKSVDGFDASLPFKSTYEILRNVSLLRHSINVAKNIIRIIEDEEEDDAYSVMLPVAVIVALGHDIGKIPEFYTDVYNKLTHPLVGARVLQEFIEGYEHPLKKTLDKQEVEIIIEAIKNHHGVVNPAAATELRFKKIIEYLKKADVEARRQEVERVLEEYGFLVGKGKKTERVGKRVNEIEENSKDVEKEIEEVKKSMEELNKREGEEKKDKDKKESGKKEEKPTEEPKTENQQTQPSPSPKPVEPKKPVSASPLTNTVNAFKEKLEKKKQSETGTSRINFKYPDFDRYTAIRPSKEEEKTAAKMAVGKYREEVLKEIPKWTQLPEAIQTGLEIIEERINYCIPPQKPGWDYIVGIFNIKGTIFVLSTVFMGVIYYLGKKLYNHSVSTLPYYYREAYAYSFVKKLREMGLVDERNMKFDFFSAPFTIFLTDVDGNPAGIKSGKYTPLSLSAVAEYFSKPIDYYENRKKDPAYCPDGYLLKFTDFRWGDRRNS